MNHETSRTGYADVTHTATLEPRTVHESAMHRPRQRIRCCISGHSPIDQMAQVDHFDVRPMRLDYRSDAVPLEFTRCFLAHSIRAVYAEFPQNIRRKIWRMSAPLTVTVFHGPRSSPGHIHTLSMVLDQPASSSGPRQRNGEPISTTTLRPERSALTTR
jgi:hypothetical protein